MIIINISFLTICALSILLSMIGILALTKKNKNPEIHHISKIFSISVFGYIIIAIFGFLWLFKYLEYNPYDFTVIYTIAIFIQTAVFIRIIYFITQDKKINYLLLIYALSLFSLLFSFKYFIPFIILISFFILLLISFLLYRFGDFSERAGYIGMLYSGISLIFEFFTIMNFGDVLGFRILEITGFMIFSFVFINNLNKYTYKKIERKEKKQSYLVLFIQYLIFITVIVNLAFIGTVGIHEFGHIGAARYYGCESRAIIYEDDNYPYSEIICDDSQNKLPMFLAGPLLPFIIGIVLMFIGGSVIRPLSFFILGFNFLASYKDLLDMGLSKNLGVFSSILGLSFLIIGVYLLSYERVRHGMDETEKQIK